MQPFSPLPLPLNLGRHPAMILSPLSGSAASSSDSLLVKDSTWNPLLDVAYNQHEGFVLHSFCWPSERRSVVASSHFAVVLPWNITSA